MQFARVREAAAEQKLRLAMERAERKLRLLQRLERAERSRCEALWVDGWTRWDCPRLLL